MISKRPGDDDQSMDFEEDYSDYYTDLEKHNDEEIEMKSGKNNEMDCNISSISGAYCL